MKVCLVKQHTTYDLYTRTGTGVRGLLESSNWRSGPLGLWEAFDCDFRIVWENQEIECQVGKGHWSQYVQGWNLWPADGRAESAESINWADYQIVIAIDVAIPTRIVRQFPQVMWCYYCIEGGPRGIDGPFRGSPFYGYNVFLNHRFAKKAFTSQDVPARMMSAQRRAVLDFPYYLQSARTIQAIFADVPATRRQGAVLSCHSYKCLTEEDRTRLRATVNLVRGQEKNVIDVLKNQVQSKYFIVHPECRSMAGNALIEAISAGSLALAPPEKLWGYPELVEEDLCYSDFQGLLSVLRGLERDQQRYEVARQRQAARMDEWCFHLPTANLRFLHEVFVKSPCSPRRQVWFDRSALMHARTRTAWSTMRRCGGRLCKWLFPEQC